MTYILNRFGSAHRIGLALGLHANSSRTAILEHWRQAVTPGPGIDIRLPASADADIAILDPPNSPGLDTDMFSAYPRSVFMEQRLRAAGVPDIVGAWFPPDAPGGQLAIVALSQRYPGHATQALMIAGEAMVGDARRFAIVVDTDIDIYELTDVLWALLTRCDPVRDISVVRRTRAGSQLLIDATKPWEWRERFAESITTPPCEAAARERWGWILKPDAADPRMSDG